MVEPRDREHDQDRLCPSCGASTRLPIVYGLPGPDLMKEAEEGRVELGGCAIEEDSPRWSCEECGHRWGGDTPSGEQPL